MALAQIGSIDGAGQKPSLGVPLVPVGVKIQAGRTTIVPAAPLPSSRTMPPPPPAASPSQRIPGAASGPSPSASAPSPPRPQAPPVSNLPAVTTLPPDAPLLTPQPYLTEGPSSGGGGGGGGGGGSAPIVQGPGTPEQASAITASLDLPPWMWVLGAATFVTLGLGGVYLITRPQGKKRAA